MSFSYLDHLDPTSEDLLRLVFEHTDDEMLKEIAYADYGMDADEHLAALRALVSWQFAVPMEWEPKEVLELVRWSQPEDPTWSPGLPGTRGHWMRLFACTVLIHATAEPENEQYFPGEDSTIVQLVDSAVKLGDGALKAAIKFLAWRLERSKPMFDDLRCYRAVGLLLLLAAADRCDDHTAARLIKTCESDETTPREMFDLCQYGQTWREVTRRLVLQRQGGSARVKEFASVLVGD